MWRICAPWMPSVAKCRSPAAMSFARVPVASCGMPSRLTLTTVVRSSSGAAGGEHMSVDGLLDYDSYDPAHLDDPYPAYRQLRDSDPVHLHAGRDGDPDFYVLSRFADIWDA